RGRRLAGNRLAVCGRAHPRHRRRAGRTGEQGAGRVHRLSAGRRCGVLGIRQPSPFREVELPMATQVLMPALSPTMEKGNLAKWVKNEGEKVKAGDVIAEIETDKATMEVEAVDEGTLGKILVPAGTADVAVNTPIALILSDGEDASAINGARQPARPQKAAESAPPAQAQKDEPQAARAPEPPPAQAPEPAIAERVQPEVPEG